MLTVVLNSQINTLPLIPARAATIRFIAHDSIGEWSDCAVFAPKSTGNCTVSDAKIIAVKRNWNVQCAPEHFQSTLFFSLHWTRWGCKTESKLNRNWVEIASKSSRDQWTREWSLKIARLHLKVNTFETGSFDGQTDIERFYF